MTPRKPTTAQPAISASGRFFWPTRPCVRDVSIIDIARALSRICRFNGHLRHDVLHYSVAEHSVRVSYACHPDHALVGLLHDGAEAYLGDPIRPMQPLLDSRYWGAQRSWQRAIAEAVGLTHRHLVHLPTSVKHADAVLLATELRDLCTGVDIYAGNHAAPLAERIVPMSAPDAFECFMARFSELMSERTQEAAQ